LESRINSLIFSLIATCAGSVVLLSISLVVFFRAIGESEGFSVVEKETTAAGAAEVVCDTRFSSAAGGSRQRPMSLIYWQFQAQSREFWLTTRFDEDTEAPHSPVGRDPRNPEICR